jgi:hypothetical protein
MVYKSLNIISFGPHQATDTISEQVHVMNGTALGHTKGWDAPQLTLRS